MADWSEVRRFALALPETVERESRGNLEWRVRDKGFVWERPLRRADLEALGSSAPDGPVLGARVADLGDKEAVLAEDPTVFFTTPHFDGYAAVLVRLERIDGARLGQLVTEAWLARAPRTLVRRYLERSD
jgi:hypothetical protein